MEIHKFNTAKDAIKSLAQHIIDLALKAIDEKGEFNFVLTGGSSPKALYQLLVEEYSTAIDWTKVFFFMGDERHVPIDHTDYNGGMARASILTPLNISEKNIFFVNTALNPEDAAADYHKRIKKHFNNETIRFDFTLLGMGADAHTASIFPGTNICDSTTANIEAVYVAKLDSWRISFTADLINNSKEIAFLAFGEEKLPAFTAVQENRNDKRFPASLISGNVHWYVQF